MPHISQPIAPNILLRSTGLRPKSSVGGELGFVEPGGYALREWGGGFA